MRISSFIGKGLSGAVAATFLTSTMADRPAAAAECHGGGGANIAPGETAYMYPPLQPDIRYIRVENHDYFVLGGGMPTDSHVWMQRRVQTPEGYVYSNFANTPFSMTAGNYRRNDNGTYTKLTGYSYDVARVAVLNNSAQSHPYYIQYNCK